MMSRVRPSCITNAIALLGFCIAAGLAQAADPAYPTRPVRLVVSFAPGGGVDATARIIAPKLTESMGQYWVVDNRAGAGGNLASEIVARANPDGHTVLLALDTQLTADDVRGAEFGMAKKGYDPMDVDDLLERVAVALDTGKPRRPIVEAARLGTARRGYDKAGVDALLDRLAPGRARRCGAARRTVHGDRNDPAPSRHPAQQAPHRRRLACRDPGRDARECRRDAASGRTAGLCRVQPATRGGRGRNRARGIAAAAHRSDPAR